MPPDDELLITATRAIPRDELQMRASRAGGAGGQHVNTSSTRVELVWNPRRSTVLTDEERARLMSRLGSRLDGDGSLRVVASDTRSQRQNRALAEERLAALVRRALVVPKKRRPTKPSKASTERRLTEKKLDASRKRERRQRDFE